MDTNEARAVRVLLVDDSPPFLSTLGGFLASQPGFEVVGAVGSADSLAQFASLRPDVVAVSLRLSGMSGLGIVARIKALGDPPLVVVLASSDDPAYRAAALAHGADGLVCKDDVDRALVPEIQALLGASPRRRE